LSTGSIFRLSRPAGVVHDHPVWRYRAICAYAATGLLSALLLAACTSAGRTEPTSTAADPSGHSDPPIIASAPSDPSTTPISPPAAGSSSPTHPGRPTVPADVPRRGPNMRTGERPPVMPVLATQHSAAGAAAFARFFIHTIDWGYATTSSAYMRHYFRPSCIECENVAHALDRAHMLGRTFIGDRFTLRSSRSVVPTRPNMDHVVVRFDVNSAEVVSKTGKFITGEAALPDYGEHVTLRWSSGSWDIVEMDPT
jgi:Family of unknown function (DUF6318)